MLIKSWLRGPWWDDAGVKHDGPVEGKLLPTDNPKHLGIIGIVDCVVGSAVGQGFTQRGIPLYLCYPLRVDYPPFLVAVKEKYTSPPIVSLNLEHWNDKWPRGGIQRVLGFVGDAAVEREAVIRSVQLPRSKEVVDCVAEPAGYDTSDWDMVLNIDPDGCKDVDDILCWRLLANGSTEFAIGIADVSAFVTDGSVLDLEARARASTLYDNGEAVDPMFPTYLSAGSASLLADDVARPVLALVFTLLGGEVMFTRWERIVTKVHAAYTYDTIMKSEHVPFIRKSISAVIGYDVGGDSHVWIETVMVLYNTAAAEMLRDKKVGMLRVHSGVQLAQWTGLAAATGCKELAWFGSSGGVYVDAAAGPKELRHAGLGKSVYCHITSPLRRYADLVNQRWLKHILFGTAQPVDEVSAELLNARCLALKSCERLLWFLRNIDVRAITTVEGFVVTNGNGGTKVYCPTIRRCLRGPLSEFTVSQKVTCRIFCDMKACTLAERYVVQLL